jgi:hypothetical protein
MNRFTKVAVGVGAGVAVFLGASLVAVDLCGARAGACCCRGYGAPRQGPGQGWAGGCPCPMCTAAAGFATETVNMSDPAAALYYNKCGSCHALPARKVHTAGEWDDVVSRMEGYAEGHERTMGIKGLTMSPAERNRIVNYLEAGAAP